MSSDDKYASFLEQANQPTGSNSKSKSESASGSFMKITSVNADVPSELQSFEQYYTSEVDEPFEPVSLKWNKPKFPSVAEFTKLVEHSHIDAVEFLGSPKDWDSKGKYKDVFEVLKKIGTTNEIRIYSLKHGKTRKEYYVVTLNHKSGTLLGLKAKAVES